MTIQNNDKVIIKKTYPSGFTEFFVATIQKDEHCLEDELYYYAPDLDNPHARHGSIHDSGIEIIKKLKNNNTYAKKVNQKQYIHFRANTKYKMGNTN